MIGCGTSLYIARAYSWLRERSGSGVTDAWPASEARLGRGYDRLLAITRSGTTTEVLTALDGYDGPATAITAAEGARGILAEPESSLDEVRGARQITFTGMGLGGALAEEAALKLRESTQSWAESYLETEYRHGPISIAEPGCVVWAFGPLVPDFEKDVAATGAHLEHRDSDPMAELVRVHLTCLLRARDLGLDASRPRHLERSVILSS